jgi:hypothetical protein
MSAAPRRVRPATKKQIGFIDGLCKEVGAVFPTEPLTVWQASEVIDALLSRKRLGLFGRAAVRRAER